MTSQTNPIPNYMKFIIGASSGMLTTLIVQPFDFLKTRMQITGQDGQLQSYRNSCDATQQIIRNEGIMAIYSGLTAALFRQATYTSSKLGIYTILYEKFTVENKPPLMGIKILIAFVAGVIGSCIGTPSDVALIRMTADGILPTDQKRNYRNVFHAFYCIIEEDGVCGLWKSALPSMSRGVVVTLVQLASYSQAKQMMIELNWVEDGIVLHFLASIISSLSTAILSMPIDIVKTRIQNMRILNGNPEYSSCWNVFHRIYKNEGLLSLWKGFIPYLLKISSHTVLMFIFFEQMTSAYKSILDS